MFQILIIQDYKAFVMNELKFNDIGRIIEDYDMQVNIYDVKLANTNRHM